MEIGEQIELMKHRQNVKDVIESGGSFSLAKNVDNTFSIEHSHLKKAYQRGIKQMPKTKVTKKQNETVKLDKLIEFLKPR